MRSDARRATLRPIKPAALLLAGLAAASPALAQTGAGFPNRPLKIVVPFPAGGPVDLTARTLAQKLAATLGQSVVVDNRAGAATNAQAFAFFDAIGRLEFKEDPRFNSVQARFANVKDYYASRVEALKAKTTAEWLEIFDKADIPAMPYHTPDSVLDDPHLNDVDFSSGGSIQRKARSG